MPLIRCVIWMHMCTHMYFYMATVIGKYYRVYHRERLIEVVTSIGKEKANQNKSTLAVVI